MKDKNPMQKKSSKRRKIIVTTFALYFPLCIFTSLMNFFWGPIHENLLKNHGGIYDGEIESILGYTFDDSGSYFIYVKAMLYGHDSYTYMLTVPNEYIDSGSTKPIYLMKKDIKQISTIEGIPVLNDSSLSLIGDRSIHLNTHEKLSIQINIPAYRIFEYDKFYPFLRPFAFILDFLISPFTVRNYSWG